MLFPSLASLPSSWAALNLSFQVCKSHLQNVPKDLSLAAWFPCAPSQDKAQDSDEAMPLSNEAIWLKVSGDVWSASACLCPITLVTETHPSLSCRSHRSLQTAQPGLHSLLNYLQTLNACGCVLQSCPIPTVNSKPILGLIARKRAVPKPRSPQKCFEADKQLVPDCSLQPNCAITPTEDGHKLGLPLLPVAVRSSRG